MHCWVSMCWTCTLVLRAQPSYYRAGLCSYTEPDILRFPISLLTASALIDGIIESLIQKYKAEDCRKAVRNANSHLTSSPKRRAVKAAQGVLLDLQEVLGYTEVSVCIVIAIF